MVEATQSTPNPEGTVVLVPQPTPLSTATPVFGVQVKNGYWTYPYPDKTPESEGNYTMGNKDSIWKYSPDGSKFSEIEFKDGDMTGNAVLWAPERREQKCLTI